MISATDSGGLTHSLRHKSLHLTAEGLVAKRMLSKWMAGEFRPSVADLISPGDKNQKPERSQEEESIMKRRVWIAIGIVVFVLGAVLLRFIPCIISQIIIIYEEAAVTDPAVCEAAAKPLARLCQSDPFFFHDEPVFAPAWLPPAICKLRPSWAKIKPEGATVEFGGGFYHYGYA